ncbi:hypothetical protein [Neisseria leonii]|uniref:hypothetical protein n=1 Tax=Neisseria leonii TaxID=2995413 RepID=UPI00237B9853|nr:hypothetical protein [Neisseria sp. 3986]MDD9325338.1 hypothetical protein [Neisseria sp. 3986]
MLAFASIILFFAVIAGLLTAAAAFIWFVLEWIYEAWLKKEPESNGWCPRLAEETSAEQAAQNRQLPRT